MTTTAPTAAKHYRHARNAPMITPTEANRLMKFYTRGQRSYQAVFNPAEIQPTYSGRFAKNIDPALFDPFFDELNRIKAEGMEEYDTPQKVKHNSGDIDEEVKDAAWTHIYVPLVIPGILTIADLSSSGFNRWIMNAAHDGDYCKFLEWRHGRHGSGVNWGLGIFNAKEAHFSRIMFFRVHFVYHKITASQTPNFGSGSGDFWRSGIARRYVRSRCRIQAKADMKRNTQLKTPAERDFSKAETVWNSQNRMDHMDKSECEAVYVKIDADKCNLIRNK